MLLLLMYYSYYHVRHWTQVDGAYLPFILKHVVKHTHTHTHTLTYTHTEH